MWEAFLEQLLARLAAWYAHPQTKLDIQIILRPDKKPTFHVLERDAG